MSYILKSRQMLLIKGIYTLTRFLPTISWGISASIIGLAFAIKANRADIDWFSFFLLLVNIILFHGIASHAINDLEDWRTGTDQLSPGIYSGGSKVISKKLLRPDQLVEITLVSLLLGFIITIYLALKFGFIILLFLFIALWSSIAYTQPPLRLSYKPLLGEWLAGFPAIVAVTLLTYYVLQGGLTVAVLIAGVAHAILAIGLLMVHHIADVQSDLQASPAKVTTVAYVANRFGLHKGRLVATAYFALVIPLSIIGSFWQPALILSFLWALPCVVISYQVNVLSIADITRKESYIFALVITHALIYLFLLDFLAK